MKNHLRVILIIFLVGIENIALSEGLRCADSILVLKRNILLFVRVVLK